MIASLICVVASVTDADTIRCSSGVAIRIAGIEANERNGTCHIERCPTMLYPEAKAIVESLTLRRTLSCVPVGRSHKRIVARCSFADGSDLRCSINSTGATLDWPKFVRRYGLEKCRG